VTLYRVRLELGRSKEAPQGDPLHAYVLVAPLDAKGHLDAAGWKTDRERCIVERIVHGAVEQRGHLAHVGQGWHFDYDASQRDDDEPLYKLDRHEIRQGEYVSVTEHDGVLRTFKVAAVTPEL
jgi:hypothetical protein